MLYEHQKIAIRNCISNARYALYHEQGLGKTISAIVAADYYLKQSVVKSGNPNKFVITVVCPAFLQQNWQNEIETWSKHRWLYRIFSYEKFASLPDQFRESEFLIVDEAHYIKNRQAKRTQMIVQAALQATRVVLLTGTPVGNRNIIDLYTHLVCLNPEHTYAKFSRFRGAFIESKRHPFDKPKTRNEHEFLAVLENHSERRLKVDCLDLPDKIYKVIECTGMRVDKSLHVSHKMQLQDGITVKVIDSHTGQLFDTIESRSKKLEALLNLIDCINDDSQIVIYVAYRESIELIKDALKKQKILIDEFHGGLSLSQKELVLNRFRNNKFRILLATMQAMNVGVTLVNCNEVIYYSRTFSCTERAQSEDRFHRIGQKSCVTYYDLVASGVDHRAFELIKENKSFDEIKKEIENAG